jgi:hypothetical protein
MSMDERIDQLTEAVKTLAAGQTAAEQRITAAIAAAEERAAERARDLQTEILRGLESFARGNHARFNSVETRQHATEERQAATETRIAALEERVLYLETRRPPQ